LGIILAIFLVLELVSAEWYVMWRLGNGWAVATSPGGVAFVDLSFLGRDTSFRVRRCSYDEDSGPLERLTLGSVELVIQDDVVRIPLLIPALLACGAVTLRGRFKRFPVASTCAACGYDLTGNTSGKCPECGQALTEVRA